MTFGKLNPIHRVSADTAAILTLLLFKTNQVMKIDEEDIERAGTRSRRQLSNSKQYSVYPLQDPSLQDAKKASQRFKHFLQRKSRSLILICIVVIVFLVLGFLSGSYSMVNKSTRTKASTFEETVHFKDSSQFADYAFLNRLLTEKKGNKKKVQPGIPI